MEKLGKPVITLDTYKQMQSELKVCLPAIEACQTDTAVCALAQSVCNNAQIGPYEQTGLNPYDFRIPCEVPGLCYPGKSFFFACLCVLCVLLESWGSFPSFFLLFFPRWVLIKGTAIVAPHSSLPLSHCPFTPPPSHTHTHHANTLHAEAEVTAFFNLQAIQKALGVDHQTTWQTCNYNVNGAFSSDWMKQFADPYVSSQLEEGTRVLIYAGGEFNCSPPPRFLYSPLLTTSPSTT